MVISVPAKSRLFIYRFFKKVRMGFQPVFQRLDRRDVTQVALGDMMIVDAAVLVESVA